MQRKWLRDLRESKGLTQVQLAQDLGVHAMTVWQWESGRRNPARVYRIKLAQTLGSAVADLFAVEEKAGFP